MLDLSNPESLSEPQFQIGDTRFSVKKMPAMEAWAVLEKIRAQTGAAMDLSTPEGGIEHTFLRIIVSLRVDFVNSLRMELFRHVSYTNASTSLVPVAGNEDNAFDGLEPIAVYEVLVRCLAVNFTGSFRAISEAISKLPSPPSTTSPPPASA